MLKHLEIENYALIEHLEIDFTEGFSVITGETGAGKSIIMGALGLVLGQRADVKAIQEGKKKCVVEALFNVEGYGLETFAQENDFDYADELVVRRELLDTGKSRAFINDTPTNLNVLKDLTTRLIDIHSQHANLLLSNNHFQMDVVDSVADTKSLRDEYAIAYSDYCSKKRELEDLKNSADKNRADRDYIQFQYDQLYKANLVDGEQNDLEQELSKLNHAEDIKLALSTAINDLDGEDQNALLLLKDATSNLQKIVEVLQEAEPLSERLEGCRIEVKDIASELERTLSSIDYNPYRKEEIEDRLGLIYSLEQKHRVNDIASLIAIKEDFEQRLQGIDSYNENIATLESQLQAIKNNLELLASKLTLQRKSVVDDISKSIITKLNCLGIPNANFVVQITPSNDFLSNGKDYVEFLFSANKNATLHNLAAIASGGEMSRVMLSIKSLIVTKSFLPTIVFDEIDTGVSGEVAHRMGEIMRAMSESMQVLSITHLPQIAAKGHTHYKVYKQDTNNATHTNIIKLDPEARVVEIAELLNGKNPTTAALDNARELLAM